MPLIVHNTAFALHDRNEKFRDGLVQFLYIR